MTVSNYRKAAAYIADQFEQFLFERGEYDFSDSEKIRWINKGYSRVENTDCISQCIRSGDVKTMIDYLMDEIATMDSEDCLNDNARMLIDELDKWRD